MSALSLPGARATNLLAGEVFRYKDVGLGPFVLHGPDGTRDLRTAEPLELHGLTTPGLYRVEGPGAVLATFAVNASDPRESDLRKRTTEQRDATLGEAVVRAGIGWLQVVLAAIALGLLLCDWMFLAGRWGGTR